MSTTLGGLATVGIWSTHPFGAGKGGAPSIVVDSRGQAHIFVPWGQLRYYTTAGGQWAEYVLPETDFVFHGSIAIDREDRLHVAYATAKVVDNRIVSHTTLRYATNRAGDWSFQTVDSEGFDPSLAAESIAVDSTGNARLSYSTATLEGTDYYLTRKYAARVGEVWKIDELELYPYAIWSHGGAVTGIGVDAQGRPHIVYAFDSFTMGYATNRTGSWEFALIPTIEGSSDLSAPIALDSMDRVHIAFFRDWEVVHAVREGAGWRNETIEQTGGIGARSISLTIDRSDSVHIGFVNRDLAQVVYVTNSGGSWKSTIVDRGRDAPYGTTWVSIAVGPRCAASHGVQSGLRPQVRDHVRRFSPSRRFHGWGNSVSSRRGCGGSDGRGFCLAELSKAPGTPARRRPAGIVSLILEGAFRPPWSSSPLPK